MFLSSFAFLSSQEQTDLRLDPVTRSLDTQVLVHETAHQWWGDLVQWKTYHDQWISEGLADYAALLALEQKNPTQFHFFTCIVLRSVYASAQTTVLGEYASTV